MVMARSSARRFAPRRSVLVGLLGVTLLAILSGCNTPTGGRSLSEAARLRLTEAADRNNPDAPDQLTLDVLRQQAQQNPNNLVIQDRFAAGALAGGLPADAATAMRRAMLIAGPTQTRLLDLGRAEIRAGNADGATEALRRAEQSGPPNAAVSGALGLAFDMNGDSPAAEAAHRRAVALAPQDWGLRGNLALSLMFAGRAAEGIRAISSAEGDSSAPRRARHNLALLLAADGQTDRAARILRSEMGPSQADALMRDYQSFAQWAGAARRDQTVLQAERVPAPPPAPVQPAVTPIGPSPFAEPPPEAVPPVNDPVPARAPTIRGGPPRGAPPVAISEAPPLPSESATPATNIFIAPDTRAMEPVISPGDPGAASSPRRRRGAAVPSSPEYTLAGVADAAQPRATEPARPSRAAVAAPAASIAPPPEPVIAAAPVAAPAPDYSESAIAPAPAQPVGGRPYQVQVAALGSEAEAQRMWESVSTRYAGIIEGRESLIVRFDRGDRVFFRLRLAGFASSSEATLFCTRLRAASQPCFTAAS